MIKLEEYMRANADRLQWLTEPEKQIRAIAGLDGATSLLANYAENVYPIVLIEDVSEGYLSFDQGFLDNQVKNVWIMSKPATNDENGRRDVITHCRACGMDVLRLLVSDYESEEGIAFDRRRTGYYPMPNVGLAYGWVFQIGFKEDVGLDC